ncbi:MAG: methyltransferase [Candidatus Aminicenantes bacterium]|nr:methyltransferase [Candidatus Aminicenantes bacterium]
MNSRERVTRTLAFRSPDRAPRQLWLLPWAEERYPREIARLRERFPDDIVTSPPFFRDPPATTGEEHGPGTYVDEWGCVFENIERGMIGEVKSPVVRTWSDAERVRTPEERLSVDAGRVNGFVSGTDRFVLAPTRVRPFEQLQYLRRPENLFLDLAERPKELFKLLNRMHDFYKRELELWASTDVDGLQIQDDWGGQDALLVSPALWREIFKPLYRDYAAIARRRGKYLFMHSDGQITDIIEDLVDVGVDALNSQLFCMDIEDLGRRFAGRLTFWGEIDRQRLLPSGSVEEVRAAVRRVRRAFWRNGGAIAQCEFGPGARPENVEAVFEAWEEPISKNRV